jgi:acetyl-CoA/propionyl-CoA carboxylase biotin carboxyl carrier protein
VIAVVEAMKMEYSLAAPFDGVVSSLLVSKGMQVARNQLVAIVGPEPSEVPEANSSPEVSA